MLLLMMLKRRVLLVVLNTRLMLLLWSKNVLWCAGGGLGGVRRVAVRLWIVAWRGIPSGGVV